MNKITIIGNLTADPELRATQAGVPVCNFTVAVNRRKKVNGTQETDFFDIVAWRQLAELCGKFLMKGKKIAVEGAMQQSTYEAKDGSKRMKWSVIASEVEFLTPAGIAPGTQPYVQWYDLPSSATTSTSQEFTRVEDDDLPF